MSADKKSGEILDLNKQMESNWTQLSNEIDRLIGTMFGYAGEIQQIVDASHSNLPMSDLEASIADAYSTAESLSKELGVGGTMTITFPDFGSVLGYVTVWVSTGEDVTPYKGASLIDALRAASRGVGEQIEALDKQRSPF